MRILLALFREIPKWDRPTQIALGIAFVLLIIDVIILSTQPDLQIPALVGAIGLLLGIQGIFMWGNRNLVTPFTQAQRHFIAGEFEQVVSVLKQYIEDEAHPMIDALILLGNAYRTLGQLVESESVLRIAIARRHDYHFALYGLGKTLLAKGQYQIAFEQLEKSLSNGGSKTIHFDMALALFLASNLDEAVIECDKLPPVDEAYRQLFIAYIRYMDNPHDESIVFNADGLVFWQAEAERFAHTPYGQAIAESVIEMQQLL
ncbi:MAG: tetratricopeptide repeat protein [Phototrophicaceae bacterium]